MNLKYFLTNLTLSLFLLSFCYFSRVATIDFCNNTILIIIVNAILKDFKISKAKITSIKVSYILCLVVTISQRANPYLNSWNAPRSHALIKGNAKISTKISLGLTRMEEAGMGLPNPIFIPVTHRAKLCKPGRATNRGTKERTLPPPSPSFTNVYTRFASSVRSVLYPWTISLPRLSWLIVSQLRESGGAKVRIRGGNEGSPLISHQIRGRDWPGNRSKRFWKEQCTHARDLETWRGREWKKSSRFEKYFTFPPIFTHFSRHFIFRCSNEELGVFIQPRDS